MKQFPWDCPRWLKLVRPRGRYAVRWSFTYRGAAVDRCIPDRFHLYRPANDLDDKWW